MSLRNFDNSNSPRLVTVINDGVLSNAQIPAGDRIIVLGFSNNTDLPVQELFPSVLGSLNTNQIINATYNIDDVGSLYPSELSVALEELFAAGATNVQVINLGKSDRMIDLTARQARERYIALENAYDLIVDLQVDRIYPVNVVAGKNGDGLYNADESVSAGVGLEVVYDMDAYATAAPTELNLSSVEGYVKIVDESYEKSTTAGTEDLVYQLANICYRITNNGSFCTGIVRTMNPMEFKNLMKVNLTASGTGTYFNGAGSTSIAANVWAICKDYNNPLAGGEDYGTVAKSGDAVLAEIEAYSSMAVPTTGGIKPVLKGTATATTALELVAYDIYFGTPSTSQMQKYFRFLNSFGTNVVTALKQGGISVVSYTSLDGVTSVINGETPDNFLFFATEDSEKPTAYSNTDIIKDDNGRNVDIGHYLDCVVANSTFTATFPGTTLSPMTFTFASGAGQILGWYNILPSNRATTRVTTNVISQLGVISSKTASDLTRNRYQLFLLQDGQYKLNRDITMGLFIDNTFRTDFINRITSNITRQAVNVATIEGRKVLGTLESAKVREGLKQKLEQEFAKWVHPEDGRFRDLATVEVIASTVNSVLGQLNIVLGLKIANEILEIRTAVTLQQ